LLGIVINLLTIADILLKQQKNILMNTFTKLLLIISILFTATADAQYCMLPGRTSYSNMQPGIINFKLKNIDRSSSNVENPLSQPSLVVTTDSAVLERGKTYIIEIKHTMDTLTPAFANARNNIRVWIDYNGDKDFEDADETVISRDLQMHGIFIDSFTVPVNAPLGTTKLRATAKMSAEAGHVFPTPCDMPKDPLDYHGEMEDYTITVQAASSVARINEGRNQVAIFPNPTSGEISLSFSNTSMNKTSVYLYDMTGRRVAELLHSVQQNKKNYSVDLNSYNIAPGLYIIQVKNGSEVSYQRINKVN